MTRPSGWGAYRGQVAQLVEQRTENPRVDGSIPSLATTSNSMIRNGFRVSPADHPWPSVADPRTIWNRVGAGRHACGISATTQYSAPGGLVPVGGLAELSVTLFASSRSFPR